jgi:UPF0271 protein
MPFRVDLNADMGESYGRWTLGDDASLMPHLTSASIACGFHGGDPHVMRSSVALAVEHGVGIGAHVGFPDLIGFGRRRISASPEEVRDYVLYQAGALQAFAEAQGVRLQHVKPHGALYPMTVDDPAYQQAVCEATAALGPDVILLMAPKVAEAAAEHGVPFVPEGYVDLDYDGQGKIVIERVKQLRDPQATAEKALRLIREDKVLSADGTDLDLHVESICVHGDAPNASEIARTMRNAFEEAGIEVVSLAELIAAPTT